MADVTQLLQQFDSDDDDAKRAIFEAVYQELHRIAHNYMRKERAGHSLQTTGLVHEAYIKLIGQKKVSWQSRAHFYGVASQVMRRFLVDYARARIADKRGGKAENLPIDERIIITKGRSVELLELDEVLDRLEQHDPEVYRIVMLKFFAGLSVEEIARSLDMGERTVKRRWQFGKAWLQHEMKAGKSDETRAAAAH